MEINEMNAKHQNVMGSETGGKPINYISYYQTVGLMSKLKFFLELSVTASIYRSTLRVIRFKVSTIFKFEHDM